MADLIADSDFDLQPGGRVVDATVMFTDLESFTTISRRSRSGRSLRPSALISYFEQNDSLYPEEPRHHHQVCPVTLSWLAWGAPVDEPAHAIRATEAACELRCLSELEVHGKKLRTRVGVP